MKLILTILFIIFLSACATNTQEESFGSIMGGAIGSLLWPGAIGTRTFSDGKNYPPEKFAAYGIVAFNSRAPNESHPSYSQYSLICEAYVATIPHRFELKKIPTSRQMVTVWPVESPETASELNSVARRKVCDGAIQNYDLTTALVALSQASAAGAKVDGTGPYLLAWSPATDKGKKDVLVLVKDMSLLSTREEAVDVFIRWRKDIESDPAIWKSGWNLEKAKSDIRQFVDLYGPKIAEFIE